MKILQPFYDTTANTLPPNSDIMVVMKKEDKLQQVFKKVMPFVQYVKVSFWIVYYPSYNIAYQDLLPDKGSAALQDVLRFGEKDVLLNHVTYMTKALEVCH